MRRVGITGGIAEGKSTVLGYLASLGYKTASADAIAKDVLSTESVQGEVAELFGESLPLDPGKMRRAIGLKPPLRRALNRVLHPHILEAIQESGAAFVEVPLLIETCIQGQFDEIWVVTCGRDEQFRRLESRVGKAEAVRLIGIQLPTEAKEPFADHVIRTNKREESVFQEVRSIARFASLR